MKQFGTSLCLALGGALVLATVVRAAGWQERVLDTSVAGGISATRFAGSMLAVGYARPASNQVIVATITPAGAVTRTTLASAVAAQSVRLCAAAPDDPDLFCVWDDRAGNLLWARKGDGWTVRPVEQEQNVSNSFALQLHRISYSFQNPLPPFNTITVELTVPMVYYRNEVAQQLERVYISGYNPGAGTFTWTREDIPAGANSGKGCDSSSFANDLYHHIVTHCAGTPNNDMLTVRLQDGWTNFTVCNIGSGVPPTSFEQGVDDLPRMAFYRELYTAVPPFGVLTNSGAIYFDSSQTEFNLIEAAASGAGNGTAPALKLNYLGRPLGAYYWADGTVHCATRSGKLAGYVWSAETCGTGRWDGIASGIDLASGVSNTYVFYVSALDQILHQSSSDFVAPDKSIFGMVSNLWSGAAVSNATLVATESNDWTFLTTQTGTNGAYAFTFIPTGAYTVTCSASNYFTVSTNVPLTAANSPYRLTFALVPVPEPGMLLAALAALRLRRRGRRAASGAQHARPPLLLGRRR